MNHSAFSILDYIVFVIYALVILFIGLFVSRTKKGHSKTSQEYFLADKSLPFWVIGATLIGSNISAEQFIGMSGSGFKIGLAIASYEWMAAATLIIVGKFLLPIYLKENIWTMPQFLERRFDSRVRTSFAIFWLLVYIFVNLSSILYLGALTIQTVFGVNIIYAIIGLALFAALYSVYGGLKAVAWTDIVQVTVLVVGGLITTFIGLNAIAAKFGSHGVIDGFKILMQQAPDHFHMILKPSDEDYKYLPGLSVLIGGMWIANLSYWGFNQYITQRAFAAKSLKEAQKGVVMAGYLKLLMPLIVVIPGIIAYILQPSINPPDKAYPWLLQLVPSGLKGLAFAALVAAIVAALSSMINSTATIFTMDLYKPFFNRNAKEKHLVTTGRIISLVSIFIAIIMATVISELGLKQAFQYIQDFTGYISPGVLVIFLAGFFWKRATANAALATAILTIPLAVAFDFIWPSLPFLDRMGIVFLILSAIMVVYSLIQSGKPQPKAIILDKHIFATSKGFIWGSVGICIILILLYTVFW
jgi:SSS family solute:Na+ symporter